MTSVLAILCSLIFTFFHTSSATTADFLQCLAATVPSELVYQQSSTSFTWVLQSSIQNPKFVTSTTIRPLCIITASDASHVQAAVRCGHHNEVRLRVRSGGHDYKVLSYRSVQPEVFAVIDLARLRGVRMSQGEASAWVDVGTTLGELYNTIGTTNTRFAFPGGRFISSGGIDPMMWKYDVGADNVINVRIVNANGDILDWEAMGEELFWSIRGGSGESFGVVVEWRLRLSKVPSMVTVINIRKSVNQGAADLLAKCETTTRKRESNVGRIKVG